MDLTQANKDFLLAAPPEECLLTGRIEPVEGRALLFRADLILGGRFAVIEISYHINKENLEAPLWTKKDILETGNIEDLLLRTKCVEHAIRMYDEKILSETPAPNVVQLKFSKASPQ